MCPVQKCLLKPLLLLFYMLSHATLGMSQHLSHGRHSRATVTLQNHCALMQQTYNLRVNEAPIQAVAVLTFACRASLRSEIWQRCCSTISELAVRAASSSITRSRSSLTSSFRARVGLPSTSAPVEPLHQAHKPMLAPHLWYHKPFCTVVMVLYRSCAFSCKVH